MRQDVLGSLQVAEKRLVEVETSEASLASDLIPRLFDMLEATGGGDVPVRRNLGEQLPKRRRDRSPVASFPNAWLDVAP